MEKFKIGDNIKVVRLNPLGEFLCISSSSKETPMDFRLGDNIKVDKVEDCDHDFDTCISQNMFQFCTKQLVNGWCSYRFKNSNREEKLKKLLNIKPYVPKKDDIAIAIENTIRFKDGDKFTILDVKEYFIKIEVDDFFGGTMFVWQSMSYFKFQSREQKLRRILNERN